MMGRRGVTYLELLVATVILLLLTALGQAAITNVLSIINAVSTVPPSQTDTIDVVNSIAGAARGAPLCTNGGTVGSAVQAGNATSITLCTSGAEYVTYATDESGNFTATTGTLPIGGATTVTTLEPGSVALNIQYCLSITGSPTVIDAYGGTDPLSDTTTSNSQITWVSNSTLFPAQLSQVLAVKITATMTRNGNSVSYATTVRLRNSPG